MLHASTSPIGPGHGLACSGPGSAAWSPALLSGKLLWLRGDTGVTTSAGHVTAWADQSGAGNDSAAIGAGTTQPVPQTWTAGNSTDAVYFDGNDSLATSANVLPTASGSAFTIFVVGSFDDLAARAIFRSNETSGGIAVSQAVGGGSSLQRWKTGVTFDVDGAARTTPLNVITIDAVTSAVPSEMYVNGTLVSTTAPSGTVNTPTGRFLVGSATAGQYLLGYVAEMLVLTGRASAPTIALWNAYTLARYGV